jgi:hypothetical protein
MDLKKTNAPVNTITYNKTVIEEPTGNVYEAITIMAKRENQINSEIKKELTEKFPDLIDLFIPVTKVKKELGIV